MGEKKNPSAFVITARQRWAIDTNAVVPLTERILLAAKMVPGLSSWGWTVSTNVPHVAAWRNTWSVLFHEATSEEMNIYRV